MDIEQRNTGEHQTVINNESGVVHVNHHHGQYTNLAGENTVRVYKEISRAEQGKFIVSFVAVCLLPGLSLVADFMQIHPAINLPLWTYVAAFGVIFGVVVVGYYDNLRILVSGAPNKEECKQLYADRLFSRTEDGYIVFTHTTACIYPDCCGKIVISTPPERYNGEYSFFGKCSLAGRQHSYGIDYNFKAYPIKVDWRPMPKSNQ
ncbi:hypothetical protein QT13_18000 [Pectobacterium brasiliense]|uniref:hypothetical protein n=1 Tax=Pectobacterium brasiliense TaxID=180957 RepID=UPI00057F011F|nr:hypothetical protein [Pectobacterium brasiliense]KHS64961.1 hypothetical protein QT13_18000 [Pectobacterium brasiliense]KHS86151.1 hypothetical protein RC83_15005 [Pectobacterium brasiliense]